MRRLQRPWHGAYRQLLYRSVCYCSAGFINLPGNKSQNYTFSIDSDDDSLLFADGKQVISDTGVARKIPFTTCF